jgi:hypothetical protein
VTEIQIAGSTRRQGQQLALACANSNWPGELLSDAKLFNPLARSIAELAQAYVTDEDDLEALGWELTGATLGFAMPLELTRSPGGDGGLT